jgi:hypothetical protein
VDYIFTGIGYVDYWTEVHLGKEPKRKLPLLVDKQKVELSGRILAGGSNEEIAIYGKPDLRDSEGSR